MDADEKTMALMRDAAACGGYGAGKDGEVKVEQIDDVGKEENQECADPSGRNF